ncbi:MAG: hypothetical protein ACOX8E_04065 [Ruminococcus sp.]
MKKDVKICMPAYKILYALAFTVILSMIRGVVYESEIGAALEPPMGLLALVFCADTYLTEISSGRNEVLRLALPERVSGAMRRRFLAETFCLFLLSLMGYGLFHWQRPLCASDREALVLLGIYAFCSAGTILFWGALSNALSILSRNMWAGIGLSFLMWSILFSTVGEKIFGHWNVFSFSFRNIGDIGDVSWLPGKILGTGAGIVLLLVNPILIKKRG